MSTDARKHWQTEQTSVGVVHVRADCLVVCVRTTGAVSIYQKEPGKLRILAAVQAVSEMDARDYADSLFPLTEGQRAMFTAHEAQVKMEDARARVSMAEAAVAIAADKHAEAVRHLAEAREHLQRLTKETTP